MNIYTVIMWLWCSSTWVSLFLQTRKYQPKIEKNIMKPADIWTTLRLPTRVSPSSPMFSLKNKFLLTVNLYTLLDELDDFYPQQYMSHLKIKIILTPTLKNLCLFHKDHQVELLFPAKTIMENLLSFTPRRHNKL